MCDGWGVVMSLTPKQVNGADGLRRAGELLRALVRVQVPGEEELVVTGPGEGAGWNCLCLEWLEEFAPDVPPMEVRGKPHPFSPSEVLKRYREEAAQRRLRVLDTFEAQEEAERKWGGATEPPDPEVFRVTPDQMEFCAPEEKDRRWGEFLEAYGVWREETIGTEADAARGAPPNILPGRSPDA